MQKLIGTFAMIVIGFSFSKNPLKKSAAAFDERETIEKISNATGEIRSCGESGVYMIWCQDRYLKLHAYNLPEAFRERGLLVKFSGNIKQSSTFEDDWGEIFEVTAITK